MRALKRIPVLPSLLTLGKASADDGEIQRQADDGEEGEERADQHHRPVPVAGMEPGPLPRRRIDLAIRTRTSSLVSG